MSDSAAYQHVARDLRDRVLTGTYAPGTKMPSLQAVEAEFNVSRATSRAAYQLLISEGIVEGRFGSGYYVRSYKPIVRYGIQRLSAPASQLSIWDTDPGTAGRSLSVDQIRVTTEPPPDRVASNLSMPTGTLAVIRQRRYVLDGKPVLLATSYLPWDLAKGTAIEQDNTGHGGVYARLTDIGQPPTWFQEDVTARMPTPDEAARLALTAGTPVLAITRLVWGPTGRPVEVNDMVGDAGSYVLRYQWDSQPPTEPPAPEIPNA